MRNRPPSTASDVKGRTHIPLSLDLAEAATGKDVFTLTDADVRHPATLSVYRIEPRAIRLVE